MDMQPRSQPPRTPGPAWRATAGHSAPRPLPMTQPQAALYRRLEAFCLDGAQAQFPLSRRLGVQQHWSPGFTQRAIAEYKKFAFLATAAGHPVAPPPVVDQVWHAHLLYTESYWGEFCPQVLQQPLHHQPSQGGAAEVAKFDQWYRQTLTSYVHFFGTPPADIWPSQPSSTLDRSVDPRRHWIVPKPSLPTPVVSHPVVADLSRWIRHARTTLTEQARSFSLAPLLGLGMLALLLSSCDASQPWGMSGPDFLWLYGGLIAAAIPLNWGIRRILLRTPDRKSVV